MQSPDGLIHNFKLPTKSKVNSTILQKFYMDSDGLNLTLLGQDNLAANAISHISQTVKIIASCDFLGMKSYKPLGATSLF